MNRKHVTKSWLFSYLSMFFIIIPIIIMELFSYVVRTYPNFSEGEKWNKYYSYFPKFISNHLNSIIFISATISILFAVIADVTKPSRIQKAINIILVIVDFFIILINLGSMA